MYKFLLYHNHPRGINYWRSVQPHIDLTWEPKVSHMGHTFPVEHAKYPPDMGLIVITKIRKDAEHRLKKGVIYK